LAGELIGSTFALPITNGVVLRKTAEVERWPRGCLFFMLGGFGKRKKALKKKAEKFGEIKKNLTFATRSK